MGDGGGAAELPAPRRPRHLGGGGGHALSARPLVLCYHGIGDGRSRLETPPEALKRQLTYLRDRGYEGVTFAEAAQARGDRVVATTFDDAEVSVLELGLPVLDRLGFRGTVFVPLVTVGIPGVLAWEQLAALRDRGWEIGSHGVQHRDLTSLPDSELRSELGESRELLEQQLRTRCRSIAYPYGRADARVLRAAATAGYEYGCVLGPRGGGPLALPRVGVSCFDTPLRFRLKVARPVRALRRTPLGLPLELLGRATRGR